jgi:hypothetical protein
VQAAEKKKAVLTIKAKRIFLTGQQREPSTNPKALQINSPFVWLVDDGWC